MNIFLLYPTQLFNNIDKLLNKKIYLLEEPIYFSKYKFHKLKLAYHRATMKNYYNVLKNNSLDVHYIDFDKMNDFYKNNNKSNIEIYELYDNNLIKKCKKYFKNLIIHDSLNFLVNKNLLDTNKDLFYKNNH